MDFYTQKSICLCENLKTAKCDKMCYRCNYCEQVLGKVLFNTEVMQ